MRKSCEPTKPGMSWSTSFDEAASMVANEHTMSLAATLCS